MTTSDSMWRGSRHPGFAVWLLGCLVGLVANVEAQGGSVLPCGTFGFAGTPSERPTVPANAPVVPLYSSTGLGAEGLVLLEELEEGGEEPFTEFRRVLGPGNMRLEGIELLEPLREGSTYRALATFDCLEQPVEVVFDAAEQADLPDSLGRTFVEVSHQEITVFNGGTHEEEDFWGVLGLVDVEWDPAAEPWRDLLRFATMVDGEVPGWPVGWGARNLYVRCGDGGFGGLEPGSYDVALTATVPGIEGVIAGTEVTTEMQCPTTAQVEEGGKEREEEESAPGLPAPTQADAGIENESEPADCSAIGGSSAPGALAPSFLSVCVLALRRRRFGRSSFCG